MALAPLRPTLLANGITVRKESGHAQGTRDRRVHLSSRPHRVRRRRHRDGSQRPAHGQQQPLARVHRRGTGHDAVGDQGRGTEGGHRVGGQAVADDGHRRKDDRHRPRGAGDGAVHAHPRARGDGRLHLRPDGHLHGEARNAEVAAGGRRRHEQRGVRRNRPDDQAAGAERRPAGLDQRDRAHECAQHEPAGFADQPVRDRGRDRPPPHGGRVRDPRGRRGAPESGDRPLVRARSRSSRRLPRCRWHSSPTPPLDSEGRREAALAHYGKCRKRDPRAARRLPVAAAGRMPAWKPSTRHGSARSKRPSARSRPVPEDACPFWEPGGAALVGRCAFEELDVAADAALATWLLELRERLASAESTAAAAKPTASSATCSTTRPSRTVYSGSSSPRSRA